MKKLLTLTLTFAVVNVWSQTYLPLKDFQDSSLTSGGWTSVIEAGTYNWEASDLGSTGDFYARSSSWNGSSTDTSVIWLISPGMDLSSATNPILTFKSACNYTGYDMEVLISTDYNGLIAPASATWTDISGSAQLSTGNFTWTSSGNVDLSSFNGQDSVHLAFKYTGGPVVGGKTWEVDNILVDETGTSPPSTVSIYNIQYTTDPSGASPYADSIVSTGGIVTAADSAGYFLQSGLGPDDMLDQMDPQGASEDPGGNPKKELRFALCALLWSPVHY